MTAPAGAGRPASVSIGRRLTAGIALALVPVLLAGCGIAAAPVPSISPPPPSVGPGKAPSAAVAQTRLDVERALRRANVALLDANVPYRPAESPRLADAPRGVFQALLPQAPAAGFVVIYEFADAAAAAMAGNEYAEYLRSGAGRVQFPSDSVFVLRQLGTTLVFFTYAPSIAADPALATVADALRSLGGGFEVSGQD